MTNRPIITEAQYEQYADKMVQNRLQRSDRYRNAENADVQQAIEDEITAQVCADLRERYVVD